MNTWRWLVLLPLAVLVAGCSQQQKGVTFAIPERATAPRNADGAPRLAGIGFQTDQFFKLTEMGMKAAAKKKGVSISLGNSAGSLDKEISLVDTYVTQKVDAILIAPYNQKASVAALKRAYDAGVSIITFDSSLDADFPISNIKSDQVSLGQSTGREAAEYIRTRMGGKANVAIVTYLSLMPIAAADRNRGFEDEVTKLPGVRVVAKQDAWIAEKAMSVVEGILTAHPEVNLIWAANEGGTVGAVTAVKTAGKAGKIVVFGTDMSVQMAGFLLDPDGILQAVTGQKPFDIGAKAVETALQHLLSKPVDKQVSLPGVLFTRRKPAEVKTYRDYLKTLGS